MTLKAKREWWKSEGVCARCGLDMAAAGYVECSTCKRKRAEIQREQLRKLRASILSAYGNACSCCGENVEEFLTIDHIKGDGKVDRSKTGNNPYLFYKKVISLGFPKDIYRILCYNCNCSLGIRGYCPHASKS